MIQEFLFCIRKVSFGSLSSTYLNILYCKLLSLDEIMFIFILLIPLMGFDKKTIVSNKQWLEQCLHENPHHVAIDPEGI